MSYEEQISEKLKDVSLTEDEKELITQAFVTVDTNQNGFVEVDEIGELFKAASCPVPNYKIRILVQELDLNKDNKLSPAEFAQMYSTYTENETSKSFKKAVKSQQGIVTGGGHTEGTQHSYSEEETVAFTNWIIKHLSGDKECAKLIEGVGPDDLFRSVEDGILLCKIINLAQPDTIDERTINKKKLNIYKIQENINLALNSASAIGCSIVNIGAQDISEGKPHLILGLLWQLIRVYLFAKIKLMRTADLAALLEEDETLEHLMNLSPENLLLRWMNFHLANSANYQKSVAKGKKISNFSTDITDSIAYACLLEQIQPIDEDTRDYELMPAINANLITKIGNDMDRAETMLKSADRLGCREFVSPRDIVQGNSKLNMAFVANLFNTHPSLKKVEVDEDLIEETREEKTFRNWMNSMGISPRVYNFANDLKDGIVLLQLFSHLDPDVVDWKKVNNPPYTMMGGHMKKLENCNYAIEIGKKLNFSLIGIAGSNINQGDETLTMALVWQLMRFYTLKILKNLGSEESKSKDKDIINWTNLKLKLGGKSSSITSFKDPCISTSHVVVDLIDCVKPGSINYEILTPGDNDEEKMNNAKYAVSMARKIGSKIYALPEDLVEVNQKMVMTVFACLMAASMDNQDDLAAA